MARKAKAKPAPKEHKDRIWIELDRPKGLSATDRIEFCERQAELATKLLHRLGVNKDQRFYWSERDLCYCLGGPMGYLVLTDNGHWFNLKYLATGEA